MKKKEIIFSTENKLQGLVAPTEMMTLKPRQELCELVITHNIKIHARNLRKQIEELASPSNRWLSIAYPISRVETNSPEARDRIMCSLAIMCYINDLQEELDFQVSFDFEQTLQPINYYFEVIHCAPYIEERPHILNHVPVFYEPGINRDVATALIYPKEELVERIAMMTGLSMEADVLKYIAQPVLMDGKQDKEIILYKCLHDYKKPIIHEMMGNMIYLTLANSDQEFKYPSTEVYVKWTEQIISLEKDTPSLDIVINSSNRVFWLPDPAEFR